MRFPGLAISLAALAAIVLLAYSDAQNRSFATSPPSAERFSIDMDPHNSPANTATSLGSRELCAAMTEDNILNFDEDFVDRIQFDVTVTGVPASNAMIGYAYELHYPAPSTAIVGRTPMIIDPIGIPPEPPFDTDGTFNVTMLDVSGTGVSGNGVLDRLLIQTMSTSTGVFPLTLSNASHIDTDYNTWAPDALDNAVIAVNAGSCPLIIDVEMVSLSLTSVNPVPIGVDTTVTVDENIRNNSPYSVNTDAETTFNVPSGCTLNGATGTVTLNAALGVISPMATVAHQETPVLRCTTLGPHQMQVTACGLLDDPNSLDIQTSNNCLTQNLNFDVVAPPGTDADGDGVWDLDEFDCGVSTFGVSLRPEFINGFDDDGDGQTDEALPTGSESRDCDGDGYKGAAETHVFEASGRDQQDCGTSNWPADFISDSPSTNRVTLPDLASFVAPVRHFNTNPGDANYDVRWDLVEGGTPYAINLSDLASLVVVKPAMFGGNRAFNGTICQPIGCTASNACCPTYTSIGVRLCLTSDRLVYHSGEPVSLKLAVTNISGGDVALYFPDTCLADTGTYAVSSGTTWGSAGLSVCFFIIVTDNLAPGETRYYFPPSNPSTETDTYRTVVKLNASQCTQSAPCYSPSCQLLTCLATQLGYAIRRVP